MNKATGRTIPLRTALFRGVFFLICWLVLAGLKPADIAVGAIAAGLAAWVSLRLLPAAATRVDWTAVALMILRFPWQSLIAGIDVARRALDPRLPLRTGFVAFRPRLPAGPIEDAFCTIMALQPGTLPCGKNEKGELLIHCLDTEQPIIEQLEAEQAMLSRAIAGLRHD